MNGNDVQIRRVFIEGCVQGVGYREFVRRWAVRLDLSGWVRNRTDGAVEALVRGSDADVEALLTEMGKGPRGSRVTRLRIVEDDDADLGQSRMFVVRPTY